jgi:hypothetical protein
LGLQQTSTAKQTDSGRTAADKKLLACAKFIDVFHRLFSVFVDENTAAASRADENVVSAGGKVANPLNQDATNTQLSGFPKSSNNLSL